MSKMKTMSLRDKLGAIIGDAVFGSQDVTLRRNDKDTVHAIIDIEFFEAICNSVEPRAGEFEARNVILIGQLEDLDKRLLALARENDEAHEAGFALQEKLDRIRTNVLHAMIDEGIDE